MRVVSSWLVDDCVRPAPEVDVLHERPSPRSSSGWSRHRGGDEVGSLVPELLGRVARTTARSWPAARSSGDPSPMPVRRATAGVVSGALWSVISRIGRFPGPAIRRDVRSRRWSCSTWNIRRSSPCRSAAMEDRHDAGASRQRATEAPGPVQSAPAPPPGSTCGALLPNGSPRAVIGRKVLVVAPRRSRPAASVRSLVRRGLGDELPQARGHWFAPAPGCSTCGGSLPTFRQEP